MSKVWCVPPSLTNGRLFVFLVCRGDSSFLLVYANCQVIWSLSFNIFVLAPKVIPTLFSTIFSGIGVNAFLSMVRQMWTLHVVVTWCNKSARTVHSSLLSSCKSFFIFDDSLITARNIIKYRCRHLEVDSVSFLFFSWLTDCYSVAIVKIYFLYTYEFKILVQRLKIPKTLAVTLKMQFFRIRMTSCKKKCCRTYTKRLMRFAFSVSQEPFMLCFALLINSSLAIKSNMLISSYAFIVLIEWHPKLEFTSYLQVRWLLLEMFEQVVLQKHSFNSTSRAAPDWCIFISSCN